LDLPDEKVEIPVGRPPSGDEEEEEEEEEIGR
jgi:hypothetical protein